MRRPTGTANVLLAAVAAVAVLASACTGDDASRDAGAASDTTDVTATDNAGADTTASDTTAAGGTVPADEWEIRDPEEVGMDPAILEGAREYAFAEGRHTQGVVVVRDGAIVAEWYADGADEESWAASWSMAKSFASALIGIAIDDGLIPGVDEPMVTYFPDWAGSPREDMTLRDVLQMSSGLEWSESYSPETMGESEIIEMVLNRGDQLEFAATRPAEVPPGERWSYSSGDSMLLAGVLEQATGMPADEYAQEVLFDPIDMEPVEWWRDAAGHTLTYCCLDTSTRGFARFGLLYLRGGAWGDEQIVPAEWVQESVEPAPTSDGYGYKWWLEDMTGVDGQVFSARGHDGQWTWVIPSLDLVVVRNGTYVKSPEEPIADPNLVVHYPPSGLVPGQGTQPPENWEPTEFLAPIIESIQDD